MQKIIFEQLDDQGKYISEQELMIILDCWPEYSRNRLIMEFAAHVGLRLKDILGDWSDPKNRQFWIGGLKVPGYSEDECFSEDYRTIKYLISKPHNTPERITWKYKQRAVPDWLAYKLQVYFQHNRHTMLDGLFFSRLRPRSYRSYVDVKRENLYEQGHLWTKEVIRRVIMRDGRTKTEYRFSFHACRAYYATLNYKANGGNLVMSQKIMGHADPRTTAKYIRFHNLKEIDRQIANTMFNLPNQPKAYIDKDQSRLPSFVGENKPIIDDSITVNGLTYRRCETCHNLFLCGKIGNKRRFCLSCGRRRRSDFKGIKGY